MFLSMQSLNGDSYQGAQVGANVQSQVGPPTRTVPDNAVQRAVPCLACVLDWAIHRAAWIITKKVDYNLTFNWIFCSGWNILPAKRHPTPLLSSKVIGSNSKHFNLRECIWLWLELLGWYWVFGYVVLPLFPVFLYCCLILLLCVVVFHFTRYIMQSRSTHI